MALSKGGWAVGQSSDQRITNESGGLLKLDAIPRAESWRKVTVIGWSEHGRMGQGK